MAQLNEQKFHALIGKMLGDLGGAFSVPTTRIGLRLGLFDALNAKGPATAEDLGRTQAWRRATFENGRWRRRPMGI